jgi:hypothetical protein
MTKYLAGLCLACFLGVLPGFGQEKRQPSLRASGYLKYLQTIFYQDFNEEWLTDNLIHNRLNFGWTPGDHFNAVLQIRNRFYYGQAVETIPDYAELVDTETGYFDLSAILFEGESYFLHTAIDRAYFDLIFGKFQLRAGFLHYRLL